MKRRIAIAILISGRGSNMAALIAAASAPGFPAEIAVVVADRADAAGLMLAREAGVEALALGGGRAAFEAALDACLRARNIELICLAGFMRILSADFVAGWRGRALNIHPSLLPAFKGLDTHARALAERVREHGCTVHWVTAELDAGEIVAQARVPVLPGDDAERLGARVLVAEHALYPGAVRAVCERLLTDSAA